MSFRLQERGASISCRVIDSEADAAWLELSGPPDSIKKLLPLAEDAMAASVRLIRFHYKLCDVENTMLDWYIEQGYGAHEIRIWDGVLKGYLMAKLIDSRKTPQPSAAHSDRELEQL